MSNLLQPQAAASPAEVMAAPGVLTSRTCWTCPPTCSLHKERVAAAAPERAARGSSWRAAAASEGAASGAGISSVLRPKPGLCLRLGCRGCRARGESRRAGEHLLLL